MGPKRLGKQSQLTWGGCRSEAPAGWAEWVFVGCILAGFPSKATEETSPSSSVSRPKHAPAGRGLLENKRGRKWDRMRGHRQTAGHIRGKEALTAGTNGKSKSTLISSGTDALTATKDAGLWTGTSYKSEVLKLFHTHSSLQTWFMGGGNSECLSAPRPAVSAWHDARGRKANPSRVPPNEKVEKHFSAIMNMTSFDSSSIWLNSSATDEKWFTLSLLPICALLFHNDFSILQK